jgi:KUP system potassium uptake protein
LINVWARAAPSALSTMTATTRETLRAARLSNRLKAPLVALGVVYGDIGTSPLYAFRESVIAAGGTGHAAVLGVLSLITWALILVVSIKYVLIVMRADNEGEGGIFALYALLARHGVDNWIALTAMLGAAMLYADGALTPAVSVLSAIEGLKTIEPDYGFMVVPVTAAILVALFAVQSRGTARIGTLFGPVMVAWFVALAGLGAAWIVRRPEVIWALDPRWALSLLGHSPGLALTIMGSVFLAVTGGEALYADMGHIGRRPIARAWYLFVLPALLVNYYGQGARVLSGGDIEHSFYALAPDWALAPLLLLATAATIIASQAIITGAYSLTRQAIQLGYMPRMGIRQTSSEGFGQIYVPAVNWLLMIATLALVVAFRSSDALAGAYGLAVSGAMITTTILLAMALRIHWRWPVWRVGLMAAVLALIDGSFFLANLTKVPHGGWLPLVAAALVISVMLIWRRGTIAVRDVLAEHGETVEAFRAKCGGVTRSPGASVFLTRSTEGIPPILVRYRDLTNALSEEIVLLTIVTETVPSVRARNRLEVTELGGGLWRVIVHFGFMQYPNLHVTLRYLAAAGGPQSVDDATIFVGREFISSADDEAMRMPAWQARIFAWLLRNTARASDFFRISPEQVLVIGVRVAV